MYFWPSFGFLCSATPSGESMVNIQIHVGGPHVQPSKSAGVSDGSFSFSTGKLPRPMIVSMAGGVPLRDGADSTAAKLGALVDGTHVMVHDILRIGDGRLKRARVVVEDGALKSKEGWLTYESSNGNVSLMEAKGLAAFAKDLPKEVLANARTAFRAFDIDDSGALSTAELKEVLTRQGGGRPLSDDDVEEVLQVFDANGDGQLQCAP